MNKRRKGKRLEVKCCAELQKLGWNTYNVPASQKYQVRQDIFGLWDVLAVKKDCKPKLIQVKSNQARNTKKHSDFGLLFQQFFVCELWVYKDRKGWTTKVLKKEEVRRVQCPACKMLVGDVKDHVVGWSKGEELFNCPLIRGDLFGQN